VRFLAPFFTRLAAVTASNENVFIVAEERGIGHSASLNRFQSCWRTPIRY
jgi:hypothetical protein